MTGLLLSVILALSSPPGIQAPLSCDGGGGWRGGDSEDYGVTVEC